MAGQRERGLCRVWGPGLTLPAPVVLPRACPSHPSLVVDGQRREEWRVSERHRPVLLAPGGSAAGPATDSPPTGRTPKGDLGLDVLMAKTWGLAAPVIPEGYQSRASGRRESEGEVGEVPAWPGVTAPTKPCSSDGSEYVDTAQLSRGRAHMPGHLWTRSPAWLRESSAFPCGCPQAVARCGQVSPGDRGQLQRRWGWRSRVL